MTVLPFTLDPLAVRRRGPKGPARWEQYVGRQVEKYFDDPATGGMRPYSGEVLSVRVDGRAPLFHIKYEDSDDEEVGLPEFTQIALDPDAQDPQPPPQQQGTHKRQAESDGPGAQKQHAGAKKARHPDQLRQQLREQQHAQRSIRVALSCPLAAKSQQPGGRAAVAAADQLQPLSSGPPRRRGASLGPSADSTSSDVSQGSEASDESSSTLTTTGAHAEAERGSSAEAAAQAAQGRLASSGKVMKQSKPGSKAREAGTAAGGKAAAATLQAGGSSRARSRAPAASKQPAGQSAGEKVRVVQGASSKAAEKAAGTVKSLPALKLVPELREHERREYAPGTEPWRLLPGITAPVRLEPDLSHEARKALAACREAYYRRFRKAEVEEEERVAAELARREKENTKASQGTLAAKQGRAKGKTQPGAHGGEEKSLSRRPDRVTESWMKSQKHAINQEKLVGFVPGIAVNDGFYSRSELSVVGMHAPPLAGIYYAGAGQGGKGVPPFAVSVVAAGCYEDDGDHGEEMVYTGEGGNNLLGDKKQIADQKMVRGNLALVGNILLGLPVRVVRKNADPKAPYGCVLVFDGLYDVVEYWSEKGKAGNLIYRYRLTRRPGQGALLSQASKAFPAAAAAPAAAACCGAAAVARLQLGNEHKVSFGGISAPKETTALNRPGVLDTDISGGVERMPIWAVNQTDDGELPPCSHLDRIPSASQLIHAHLGLTAERLEQLRQQGWQPRVEYVGGYVLAEGVPRPQPPVLPPEFEGRPHDYLKQLNHGSLPYHQSKPGRPPYLVCAKPVVYECGPWCKCPLGTECPQAASQRGLHYRLELFRKADGTGWAVRNLDMIPQWSFICMYYGEVFPAEEYEHMMTQGYDGSYCTDLVPRPDVDWNGDTVEDPGRSQQPPHARFVVCGLRKRNVGAFLNHSCDPNVFVQPVLSEHHDASMPGIAMFAAKDIMPLTELAWDYGTSYVLHQLEGRCKCGAQDCIAQTLQQQGPTQAQQHVYGSMVRKE
ncbi:hypothetical protein N2152v2_006841 [Parachlorella kessleri]